MRISITKCVSYKAAIVALNNFKNNFPDSEFLEEAYYLVIVAEYRLAEQSIFSKQEERYKGVVEHYKEFVDKYPSSSFLREAEKLYADSLEKLNKSKNKILNSMAVQSSIITRDVEKIAAQTGNLYESVVVISKRARQIAVNIKEELNNKLAEFATTVDNLEEVFENREQIEISKFYERMPKPTTTATEEFLGRKA